MAIEFSCSSCNTTLRVPDEHAGKQARCPKCQSLNLIQAGVRQPDSAGFAPAPPAKPVQPPMGQPVGNPYAATQGSVLPPGGARRAYQSAHRGPMILTLGIMSLVCNFMLIPGILAWVMGRSDLKQMDAGRMDPEGRGLTMAGMILGIISTSLVALVLLFYLAMILIFIGTAAAAGGGAM